MSFFAKTPTKIAAGPFQEPLPKHTSSGKVDQCAIECGCLNLGLRNAGFCNLKLACSGLPQSRAWEAFVVAKPKFQFAQCIYNPLWTNRQQSRCSFESVTSIQTYEPRNFLQCRGLMVLSVFPPKGSQGPIIGFVSRNSDMRKPGSCKRPGPHAYLLSFISFRNNPDCEWEKNGEEHKGLWHSLSFWDLKTPRHDLDETQRFNLTVLQGFCAARSHARDFFPIASYTGAGHKGTGWLNRQWSAVHRRSDSFFPHILCRFIVSFERASASLYTPFALVLLVPRWTRGSFGGVGE